MKHLIQSAIWGLAVGDALGVPFEFSNRLTLQANPVTEMMGGLMYRKPIGTWSDDTSMTLCLLDSLAHGYSPEDVMRRFADWYYNDAYTATGETFDVGRTCSAAISRFHVQRLPAGECADTDENSNGNGALMRILPLLFYLKNRYGDAFIHNEDAQVCIREITGITHGHPRCTMANGIYLSIAQKLAAGMPPVDAVRTGAESALCAFERWDGFKNEAKFFQRIREPERFSKLDHTEILSYGYVINTLEAAVWCLLTTDNYPECVLKAVNLGCDTDTNAAVAGGLAGLCYGFDGIPSAWRVRLQNKLLIETLCNQFSDSLETEPI